MMECNKDEAIRVKGIAESKMQSNDFAGARKFALKAQHLYQGLENVSQMIMVCDVHCSSQNLLFGNEMDWYGILQIDQLADEATIKKQYRKFALQLHPDKNKLPGAETAFKLIAEAQRILLDKDKRNVHDIKRKASMKRPGKPYHPSPKPTYTNVGSLNKFGSTFTGSSLGQQRTQEPAQPGISNGSPTFWTICPFCTMRYQFYRNVVNKSILCQTCKKPFLAYERGEPKFPVPTNKCQPAFFQKEYVPSQATCKVEQVFKGNLAADSSQTAHPQKTGSTSDFGKEKINVKRKRKQIEESSESRNTASSSVSEVDKAVDEGGNLRGGDFFGHNTDPSCRRSSRLKRQGTYSENLNDDNNFVNNSKMFNSNGSSFGTVKENGGASREDAVKLDKLSGSAATLKNEQNEAKQKGSSHLGESLSNVEKDEKVCRKETKKENVSLNPYGGHADVEKKRLESIADSNLDSSSGSAEDPDTYDKVKETCVGPEDDTFQHHSAFPASEPGGIDIPETEFFNFDAEKSTDRLRIGQFWSLYSDEDSLPKYYGKIVDIKDDPGFKIHLKWLEGIPPPKNAFRWHDEDMPISCGRFRIKGKVEKYSSTGPFSHLVSAESVGKKNEYEILPRNGDIWAVYKNWDAGMTCSDLKNCEYDIVEIIKSDNLRIEVLYLERVAGFNSVFKPKNEAASAVMKISIEELLRFSHQIPAFKLTEERGGSLRGCWELDPAAFPLN